MSFRFILLLTCFLIYSELSAGNNFAIKTIVIDAGHGGKDPGAIGAKGTQEKNVALAVALKLGEYIEKNYPNVKVVYTRKTDVFLELHERAEIANKNKADLFIAVHCNSNNNPDAYGSSTYVLGLHRSEANLEVAKRENSVILLEEDRDKNYEFDPNTPEGHIIMSMKQNAFLDQSIDFASKIENQMENGARRKSMGVKQAGFYVLYKTAMPSLLAEIGFISNPEEEKFLASEKGQDQIANALYGAFKDYKTFMEKGEGDAATNVPAPAEEVKVVQPEVKPEPVEEKKETQPEPPKEVAPVKTEDTKVKVEDPKVKAEEPGPVAEEPKAKTETPDVAPETEKPKQAVSTAYTTLQSGKTIKKPIDVLSGGGKSTTTLRVAVKPSSPATAAVEKEAPPVKTPNEPAPVPSKVEKAPTPVTPVQKPAATVTKPAPVTERPATEKKPEPVVSKKPEPVASPPASESGVVFKVQLFALKGDLKAGDRDKLTRVFPNYTTEPTPSGFVRYYGSSSRNFADAKRSLIAAISHGYSDAFVVGFKNGRKLSAEELKAAEGK